MTSTQSEWPESLDALTAAPDHHLLLLENDHVRVLQTCIAAGDRTAVHTHQWPSVLQVKSFSHFVRYDGEGNVVLDTRTIDLFKSPPTTAWSDPLTPHSLENVGDTDLDMISVEIKK